MKRLEVDRTKLSPGMKQYMEIKDEHEDELLFYRLGDFYELFFEDGILCSRELELTLTGKSAGLEEKVPMCGVPYHSVKPYIEKLISKGYKVAICEQLEDPKNSKGMVKRGVVALYSKGTIVDYDMLNSHDSNYIASVLDFKTNYILTYADISTGDLYLMELTYNKEKLINKILSLGIKEVVLSDEGDLELISLLKNAYSLEVSINREYLENKYENIYKNIKDYRFITGIKHLLYYLVVKQLKELEHIKEVIIVNPDDYLRMDIHTIRNLELVETLRLKERTYSLVWLLDKCKTSMGSRKLKNWILNPLKDEQTITKRYDMITKLNEEFIILDELRDDLNEVYDLERLCGKVVCGVLNARDVLQIKKSLIYLPSINKNVEKLGFPYEVEEFKDLYKLLDNAIYEEPPIGLKEGYLIKDGYNSELDELKKIRSGGKDFIAALEEEERKREGERGGREEGRKVFGYYIEISKGQAHLVDPSFGYERRQTLTNYERFISPQLKEKEALILNAEEKIIELEFNLFNEVKEEIKRKIIKLKEVAEIISELDAIASLAVCASEYNLVRPNIIKERKLEILEGRHPVVEKVIKDDYIANDIIMGEEVNTLLITGPNMSGKSTYMRQLAITIIMAQIGSFVPAKSCTMPLFDQIFTRIGASDDLVSGESTFMVEMKEAKNAICNATEKSLILFDELGRGTATYDGISLAQAILEYINTFIKCKTLFSTHYHELTSLQDNFKSIKNVHVEAKEQDGKVTFLHQVKDGPVDKSYGIHVARLAGMPDKLLERSNEILKIYEDNDKINTSSGVQVSFDFESSVKEENKVLTKLKEIDPLKITPMEAINLLYELKELDK